MVHHNLGTLFLRQSFGEALYFVDFFVAPVKLLSKMNTPKITLEKKNDERKVG
jgi:hypothetical protein